MSSFVEKNCSILNRSLFDKDVMSLFDDAISLYNKSFNSFQAYYIKSFNVRPLVEDCSYCDYWKSIVDLGQEAYDILNQLTIDEETFAFDIDQHPLLRLTQLWEMVNTTCSYLVNNVDYTLLTFCNDLRLVVFKLNDFQYEIENILDKELVKSSADDSDIEINEADEEHHCQCGGHCACENN